MSDIESTLAWIDEQARYLAGPNMGRLIRLAAAYRDQARQIEELRQGLWDCFRIAGGDTDGNATPRSLASPLVPLVLSCVSDLRKDYDTEVSGLPGTGAVGSPGNETPAP